MVVDLSIRCLLRADALVMQAVAAHKSGLVAVVIALLLSAMVGSWAHAAVHAGESDVGSSCASCHWVKHSPMVAAPCAAAIADASPDRAHAVVPQIVASRIAAVATNPRAPPSQA